ncbi:MAG: FctA domain-containing protein, partial [Eubacteriales bacterium]|nr:FctA domain-containing protein [Eubacteriales bacterium]
MSRKGYRTCLAGALLAVLVATGVPATATVIQPLTARLSGMTTAAETAEKGWLSVTATATGAGKPSPAERYTVTLTAEKETAPMPPNSDGKTCTLTLVPGVAEAFQQPEYTARDLGSHRYTIAQTPGTDENCTYDDTKYTLNLTIYYDENDALQSVYTIRQAGEKTDAVTFTNEYAAEPPVDPKPPIVEPDPPDDPK